MAVSFDSHTGSLHLDEEAFAALQQLASDGHGSRADQARLAELRKAGVLRGDIPHPQLAHGLAAVAEPICRLELRNRHFDGSGWRLDRGDGWIGPELAALFLPRPDGAGEFLTLPVMFLPEAVALTVALGPRPRRPGAPLQVPSGLLEALCATADATHHEQVAARFTEAAALGGAEQRQAAQALSAGVRRCWEARTRWAANASSSGERLLQVVDSAAGMWLVEPDDPHVTLWPATPTMVWQELAGLLPRPSELQQP